MMEQRRFPLKMRDCWRVGKWNNLGDFPEDLQWEALVDVLRGRVKVHNHCYEAVDLDNMVRVSVCCSCPS